MWRSRFADESPSDPDFAGVVAAVVKECLTTEASCSKSRYDGYPGAQTKMSPQPVHEGD
jgi:hypothetical protein